MSTSITSTSALVSINPAMVNAQLVDNPKLLAKAARRAELRNTLGNTIEIELRQLAEHGEKFSVILADPPWNFKTFSENGRDRSADNHYTTKPLNWIKGLGPLVSAVADKDSILFLWTTDTFVNVADDVIQNWGFKFATVGFHRGKLNEDGVTPFFGNGYYTRANCEQCWIGRRGKGLTRADAGVPRLIMAKRREHSRKPDEAHERIERLYPDQRYLELFGRIARARWQVLGNQAPGALS